MGNNEQFVTCCVLSTLKNHVWLIRSRLLAIIGVQPSIESVRTTTAAMSSIPKSGQCLVCGDHTRLHCSFCQKNFCSQKCMKEGWPQHKLVCQPSHLGIRSPTYEEYEKAVKKARIKLGLFMYQVNKHSRKGRDGPECGVGLHPDLDEVMSSDWIDAMLEWREKAQRELMDGIASGIVKFDVTGIGSVLAEVKLNGKDTRLQLHLPDSTMPSKWLVVMEPIANSPNEAF